MILKPRTSLRWWLTWHCIAGIAIVALPAQLHLGRSIAAQTPEQRTFLGALLVAYLACAALLAWRMRKGGGVAAGEVVMSLLACIGLSCLGILFWQAYYSPFLLLATLALAAGSIAGSFLLPASSLSAVTIALAAMLVAAQALNERPKDWLDQLVKKPPLPRSTQAVVNSRLYPMKATFYESYFDRCDPHRRACTAPRNGGGMSRLSDGYLLATGEGALYFFKVRNASLMVTPLPQAVPLNSDAFASEGSKNEAWLFRVMGLLSRQQGERFTLFATHHYWHSEKRCFVVRVSRIEGSTADLLAGRLHADWQTIFETKPCLPLKSGPRGRAFAGDESGGRMALLDPQTLLVTVGDHQFDGWNSDKALAQEPTSDYGKTIRIDLASGKASVYTQGHRNAQGLFVAADHTVWSTEHGPSGGDELNLLVQGKNYGWPLVTYGVEYKMSSWPLNKTPGDHAGFERPVFSWMPSIAVSALTGVEGKLFPLWKGDLLVCSYLASLQRVRVRDGRVAYVERIQIRERNGRLRDIMEDAQGRIMLWIDGGTLAVLEPVSDANASGAVQPLVRGEVIFSACTSCHRVGSGNAHGIGPDLAGIVGRKVASAPGFHYSSALSSRSADHWTAERLDAYLSDPQKAIPGTTMQFEGMQSAEDRASLIAYLKTLRGQ